MDILYHDAFERRCPNMENLKPLYGTLVSFLGEPLKIKGYITLETTFGARENSREVKVRCLFIDTH